MNNYQPRKILVTGGAGFIGSHFIRFILNKYQNIFIINLDLLTYAACVSNLNDIKNDTRYHFVQGNILDKDLLVEIFDQYKIDTVVHFAAETHVDRSIQSPDTFINTNINGTFTLLNAAFDSWKKNFALNGEECRFHHISTDEVYGSLNAYQSPFTEESAYDPSSPYSASKGSSDLLVRAYARTYQLPVTVSNCSNNFGPYQHPEKFIPTVINACIKQEMIPVYGNGSNIRDWLYVIDHCHAIDKIIRFGKTGSTYNVGANNERSNIEVVKIICNIMDSLYPIECSYHELITFVKDRPGHDWRYAINASKLSNELSWSPTTSFFDSLTTTIQWYVMSTSSRGLSAGSGIKNMLDPADKLRDDVEVG